MKFIIGLISFNEGIKLDKFNRSTILPDEKTKLQNEFNNELLLGMDCLWPSSEIFLRCLKNYLTNSMLNERLCDLSIIHVEKKND